MEINLADKRILVTGASRGVGNSIARHLLKSGATVALHYNRNREPVEVLKSQFPDRTHLIRADLANIEDTEKLFTESLAALGGLDVLINNAGLVVSMPMTMQRDQWEKAWDLTMDVNLKSVAYLSRLAVGEFAKSGGGRIIMIASRAAFRGDTEDYMAYAASKGGMVAFTRSIARAFGKQGVKAFLIAPGFVRTDMAKDAIELYGEDYVVGGIALDRLTEPDDISPMVVLLASGLSDHATGCTIDINAASYVH